MWFTTQKTFNIIYRIIHKIIIAPNQLTITYVLKQKSSVGWEFWSRLVKHSYSSSMTSTPTSSSCSHMKLIYQFELWCLANSIFTMLAQSRIWKVTHLYIISKSVTESQYLTKKKQIWNVWQSDQLKSILIKENCH